MIKQASIKTKNKGKSIRIFLFFYILSRYTKYIFTTIFCFVILYKEKRFVPADDFAPEYLRKSQAERVRDEGQ